MKLKLLQVREAQGESCTSTKSIIDSMAEESKADRECFWVIHLNTQLKVIEKELVAMGTLDQTSISPREVFKKAIINSAAHIITVHNHPGGSNEPSQSDFYTWDKLTSAGELLGITVLDHLIITPNGSYYSQKT